MASMRVHELAKELNISSKDIIEILNSETKTYKTMSGLGDSEIATVRGRFGKTQKPDAAVRKSSQERRETNSVPKTARPAEKEKDVKAAVRPSAETPPKQNGQGSEKKSHISQVYFPQNSTKSGHADRRPNTQRNDGQNRNNNPAGRSYAGRTDNRPDRPGQGNRGEGSRGNYPNNRNDNRGSGQNFRSADRPNNNGGYRSADRPNNGNYRSGDRPNPGNNNRPGGYAGNGQRNDNRSGQNGRNFSGGRPGQGGFRNDSRPGQNNFRNDGRPGGAANSNAPGRRNDRKEAAPKEEFILTKPDARRPDARKDKNERKKDIEIKENLKFANSPQAKKQARREEKPEETIKQLILPDTLTIKELADKMKVQPSVVVKKLFLQGKVVTINQEVDYDTAEEIALEFNCICDHEVKIDVIAELLKEEDEDESKLVSRPPVVCVMGHVDHGKTSLLDAIRETHVTAKESGGITQKIGAYTVEVNGNSITFLDTPGHEAFTAMRMRGAQATDIAILVVAADDGVMPQTIEAINHAKAAGVEIIVAVNKIDKPNANIEKVKQELTEYELIAEDWGGSTIFVPVSAHSKEGIEELLEMILLTAEVHELKANPDRWARGIVIEAELDKGRGPVATILVQKGTLHVGDNVAAGACYGKIRAMIDDKGRRVKEVGPSMPVEILGLNDVPNAGEIIMAMDSEKEARSVAETFISEGRKKLLDDTKHKVSLDALFEQIQAGNVKELGIIIKADVQGSVEAVKQSLLKLSNEEVVVKVIHGGVGNINESDVVLASASNAIIIGFNVKPDNQARIVAEREKVDLRLYNVIYNAIEDVEAALKGMLEPIYEEQVMGHVEIRQIFKASGVGNIAGSFVTDGRITRNATVRINRDGKQLYEGPIATLKRFKDEVKEVKAGYECGLVFEKFNDIQEGDIVEAYEMVEVPR